MHQLEKAYKIAGKSFQLSSPHQVEKVLFEQHQIFRLNNIPSGRSCRNAPVLDELAGKDSLPKIVIEYHQVTKLKHSYTDKLLHMINFTIGRLLLIIKLSPRVVFLQVNQIYKIYLFVFPKDEKYGNHLLHPPDTI
ncbi:MAG: DNA polymerase [Candidatus Dasytiphilus stammeri]